MKRKNPAKEKKSSLLVRKSFKGESFEPTFDE